MNGYLVLQSGEIFSGVWRGGQPRAGEVVFNTACAGYEEMASDPSYFSQILVMTSPMQGNYGIDRVRLESRQYWIEGFICLEMQRSARDSSWLEQLTEAGIPVLTGVDTRRLVLHLRNHGTPWGAVVAAESPSEAKALAQKQLQERKALDPDWAYLTSRRQPEFREGLKPSGPKVAVLDYGCKENILRSLSARCRELAIFPSRASAEDILAWKPDGIVLSNGPGDPKDVQVATQTVQDLLGKKMIFGICMGHQILAQALGAKTFKLKFGHRGANHPVRDTLLNRIYVTSQNHGYAVDAQSLPKGVDVTHVNLNDGTVQGLNCPKQRCFSVQFHPECHPGPNDAAPLFDYFIKQIS